MLRVAPAPHCHRTLSPHTRHASCAPVVASLRQRLVDRGQPRDDLRLAPTDMSGTRHGRATDMRLEAASASHRSSSARRAAALSLAGGAAAAATYSSAAS